MVIILVKAGVITVVNKEKQMQINKALEFYLENDISVNECAKKFDIHRTTLGQHLKSLGINTRKKHTIDDHFFDTIDSEEKAYILGYLTADGCIKNRHGYIKIGLSSKDINILYDMQKSLKTDYPIKTYKVNAFDGEYEKSELTLLSHWMYDKLVTKYNFSVNKSCNEKPAIIPKELQCHYVRGLFDGDGWFHSNNNSKELGIGMGKEILLYIRKIFVEEGISEKYFPLPHKTLWRYRITSDKNIKKAFEYLYKNAHMYLCRKYDKIKKYCRLKTSPQKS